MVKSLDLVLVVDPGSGRELHTLKYEKLQVGIGIEFVG